MHHILLFSRITQLFVCEVQIFLLLTSACVYVSLSVGVLGYRPGSSQVHSSIQLLCGASVCPRGYRGDEGNCQTSKGLRGFFCFVFNSLPPILITYIFLSSLSHQNSCHLNLIVTDFIPKNLFSSNMSCVTLFWEEHLDF